MRRSIIASVIALIFVLTLILPMMAVAQTSQTGTKATKPKTVGKGTPSTMGKSTATTKKPHAVKRTTKKSSRAAVSGRGPCPVYGKTHRYRSAAATMGRGAMKCTCGKTYTSRRYTSGRTYRRSAYGAGPSYRRTTTTRRYVSGRGPCAVYGKSHRYRSTMTTGRGTSMRCACGKTYTAKKYTSKKYTPKRTYRRSATGAGPSYRRTTTTRRYVSGRGPCPVYGKSHRYRSAAATMGRGAMKCTCGKTYTSTKTHKYTMRRGAYPSGAGMGPAKKHPAKKTTKAKKSTTGTAGKAGGRGGAY